MQGRGDGVNGFLTVLIFVPLGLLSTYGLTHLIWRFLPRREHVAFSVPLTPTPQPLQLPPHIEIPTPDDFAIWRNLPVTQAMIAVYAASADAVQKDALARLWISQGGTPDDWAIAAVKMAESRALYDAYRALGEMTQPRLQEIANGQWGGITIKRREAS